MWKVSKRGTERQTKSSHMIIGAVTIAVVVAFALGVLVGAAHGRRIAPGSTVPICRTSSLTLTTTGNVGAGNASYTIVFHNTGSQSCSMQGYPAVVASIESKPSVIAPGAGPWPQLEEIAQSTRESQAGGVIGSNEQLHRYRLPTVLLRARTGVASTTIDWGEQQPNPETKCWTVERFIVTPPRNFSTLILERGRLLCSQVFVSPIVPGRAGVLYLK